MWESFQDTAEQIALVRKGRTQSKWWSWSPKVRVPYVNLSSTILPLEWAGLCVPSALAEGVAMGQE